MKIKTIVKNAVKKYRVSKLKSSAINGNHSVLEISSSTKDYKKMGFSLAESSLFELGSVNDYKNYISTWESYQPIVEDSRYACISGDKYLFSIVINNFVSTPTCLCFIIDGHLISLNDSIVGMEDLRQWAIGNGGCVIKDREGCDGFDVFVLTSANGRLYYKDKEMSKQQFEELVITQKNSIIQERMQQGSFANNLFPYTTNTLRLITMKKAGASKHEVVAALQRIGSRISMPVDNFNQGGLSALVDLDSGVLGKAGSLKEVDKDGHHVFYANHPDTGAQIEGISIPNWDKIKSDIEEITLKFPFFEYIAWDIIVQDNGISVLEINRKSSLNLFQIHGGMRNSKLGNAFRERGWLVD